MSVMENSFYFKREKRKFFFFGVLFIVRMDRYRQRMEELFGEENFSEDEETIRKQQGIRDRMREMFGSDSEPEREFDNGDETDVSDDDGHHESDIVELACSDIGSETEEGHNNIQIGRVKVESVQYNERRQAKELAQFQRQVAARIHQRQCDEELNEYGIDVFQRAEQTIITKGLIEATVASIHSRPTRAERRASAKRAWYKRKKKVE